MNEQKIRPTGLDVRITVAVAACYLTSTVLKQLGILVFWEDTELEIIQAMTACFACLLCCQDNTKISLKSGINRLIITAVGGIAGICVVLIDQQTENPWLMAVLVPLGVLVTLIICKAVKVPYINARIGGLTFILVSCTLTGSARVLYAGFRLLSTLYGVLITLLVTWIWTGLGHKTTVEDSEKTVP